MKSLKSLPRPKKPKLFMLRRVRGESMLPTLRHGKFVVGVRANRAAAGDIVIIRHGSIEKIKRVQAVRDGGLFVVGDNLAMSTDSRFFGWLSADALVAKVIWPLPRAFFARQTSSADRE